MHQASVLQSSLLKRTGGLDERVDWNWYEKLRI